MRRLLIIPLLLFFNTVLCQEYQPFNFEKGNWVFEWFSYGESPNGSYNGFTQYWSSGDTLINDSIYFKFYKYTIRHNNYGLTDTIFNYCGAIRHINAKQIVYVKPDVDTACIIYDFNLRVGDTIRCFPPDTWFPYDELIVQSVDSILICGRYHKSFTLNDTIMTGPTVLIEGIGFNSGLLRPIFDQFEHTNWLYCYVEPNNTNCESCNLLMYIGLNGQNYYPFPVENVNWNVYLEYSLHENPTDTVLLRYTLHGDTTINLVNYKKLCLESGDTLNPEIETIGGLREQDKKIYFIGQDFLGHPHEEELLLYDFNAQIGDTVKHDNYGTIYSIIENIDSIEIDGEYRKRYKVYASNNYYFPDQEYWIEGIGSIMNGLLGNITSIPLCCYHYWEHICFKENEQVKYLNPSFSECFPDYLLNSMNECFEISKINIYPNPFSNELHIDNIKPHEKIYVRIIDNLGRMIVHKKLTAQNNIIIVPEISGSFLVLIINNNYQILKKEKIIQK